MGSEFVAIGLHHGDSVTGASVSISDGNGYGDSDGIMYFYLPKDGMIYRDLMEDSRASLTFSEMAIANGTAPGCKPTKFPHFSTTAESPPCIRLTIIGKVTPVPLANRDTALKHLFNRHPEMKSWSGDAVEYVPFWMAPDDIDEFFLIPFYGGSVHFTSASFLAARWYRGGPE